MVEVPQSRSRVLVIGVLAVLLVMATGTAEAQSSKCDAGRAKALGKMVAGKLTVLSKNALKPDDAKLSAGLIKQSAKGRKSYAKLDKLGSCLGSGDFRSLQEVLDDAVVDVGRQEKVVPDVGCTCTVECFFFNAPTVGGGTGWAADALECARLADAFCIEQIEAKYPDGMGVYALTSGCAGIVPSVGGCLCNASCTDASPGVSGAVVESVEACAGEAETTCGSLDNIDVFACTPNP